MPPADPQVEKLFHRYDRSLSALQRRLSALARAPDHKIAHLAKRAQRDCAQVERLFELLRPLLPPHLCVPMDLHLDGLKALLADMLFDARPN
jgi:hypothetical protein